MSSDRRPLSLRWIVGALVLLVLSAPAAAEDDVPSGTIELGVAHALKSLDPARSQYEGERTVILNVFDQLYQYHHLRRPHVLIPCLASGMPEVSEDGRTVTIRIDPAAKFADDACFPGGKGRQVTAADVVFCFKRLMDKQIKSPGTWVLDRRVVGLDAFRKASADRPENPRRTDYSSAQGYPDVAGLEAVDTTTLRIRLTRACPELPWLLATSYTSIYPPEAVASYGDKFGRKVVSSGPYRVSSFVSTDKVILGRNLTYRGATYPTDGEPEDEDYGNLKDAGKPLPRNGLVVVRAYTEFNSEWNAFLAGAADCAALSRDAALSSLDASRRHLIPVLRERGIKVQRLPRLEIQYYVFNMEDKVLGTPAGEKGLAIRRAISLACDETWTVSRLHGGLAERVYGPILPEFPEYDPVWGNDWTLQPGDDRPEALEIARELLAEVGHPGGKGLPTFKMLIGIHQVNQEEFAHFRTQMAEIGLKFEAVPTPWNDMLKALRTKQYQILPTSWMADYPDAHNFLQLYYGPHSPDPNFSHYNDADYNDLFERSLKLSAKDPRRERLYHRMRNKIADECAWVYRFRRVRYSAVHPWMRGFRFNDLAPKYFQYLWVDDAARKAANAAK